LTLFDTTAIPVLPGILVLNAFHVLTNV